MATDDEMDVGMAALDSFARLGQPADPTYFHAGCRYAKKRAYISQEEAQSGADRIKAQVEYRGGTYRPLGSYPCPDGDHWHLSSAEQGEKPCATCAVIHPAWKAANGKWVVAAHGDCPTAEIDPLWDLLEQGETR